MAPGTPPPDSPGDQRKLAVRVKHQYATGSLRSSGQRSIGRRIHHRCLDVALSEAVSPKIETFILTVVPKLIYGQGESLYQLTIGAIRQLFTGRPRSRQLL